MRRRAGTLLALSAVVLLSGCGGGGSSDTTTTPVETADAKAKLPPGWARVVNYGSGFELVVPPGWGTKEHGVTTLLSSPDRLVGISITSDRTDEALALDLNRYATQTVHSLSGFKDLRVNGASRTFHDHYPALSIDATGRDAGSGVSEKLTVVIIRRPKVAAFPVLVARNAKIRPGFHQHEIDVILRSLRSRPPEVSSSGP